MNVIPLRRQFLLLWSEYRNRATTNLVGIDELELSQRMAGQGAATGDLMISYDAGSREYALRLDGSWDAGLGADDFLFT
ncbi:hypothetical protein [Paracoccus saliphilus]|uniref:Uncharacterized protein n=1 Tax=Paracoccus saliphilus TaxID=405559 RepID=A0AA45W5U4_9RHOB|nr:hypothetical protein [Paracoccus saliphilus]WCR05653.1 hypothetical protein JHX88_21495 [Paracoccus saliphilus]SIS96836.1 hypothetical protein SAMN05421772_110116 [Paracoccus saliphilus]